MDCLRCHREVPSDAHYCPGCGAAQQAERNPTHSPHRLVRIPSEQKIAGVCAGIADYLDVDVTLIRAAWLALSIVPGAIIGGLIAYILAWMVMPIGQSTRAASARRLTRSTTDAKVAGVCAGLADYLGVDATPVRVLWIVLSVLPGAVVGGLVAYLIAWMIVPKAPLLLVPHQTQAA